MVTSSAAGKTSGRLLARKSNASTPPADVPTATRSRLAMGALRSVRENGRLPHQFHGLGRHARSEGTPSARGGCPLGKLPAINLSPTVHPKGSAARVMADVEQIRDSAEPDPAAAPGLAPTIVAIGASAGGIQALQSFFAALPTDTGAAYIVVVHLDPGRHSELPS